MWREVRCSIVAKKHRGKIGMCVCLNILYKFKTVEKSKLQYRGIVA